MRIIAKAVTANINPDTTPNTTASRMILFIQSSKVERVAGIAPAQPVLLLRWLDTLAGIVCWPRLTYQTHAPHRRVAVHAALLSLKNHNQICESATTELDALGEQAVASTSPIKRTPASREYLGE